MTAITAPAGKWGCRAGRALAGSGLVLAAALVLAACGGSSSTSTTTTTSATTSTSSSGATPATTSSATTTTPSSTTAKPVANPASVPVTHWLSSDASTKSAKLTLDAADGSANGGYNFDGYANGDLVVTVPTGWKVTVVCKNKSTTMPHSCAIVKKAGDTTPAFAGASTPEPTTGLSPGHSATFTFTPTTAGTYRIDCLVPGHDKLGMWATLKVASSGSPSIAHEGHKV